MSLPSVTNSQISGLAKQSIKGIVSANPSSNYIPPNLLVGNSTTSKIKEYYRTLPFRRFVSSLGITISFGSKNNEKTLAEYNHEKKNAINLYSFSTQMWLHEVVHAIDDRVFGIQNRINEGKSLTWTHEYIADIGSAMLMLYLDRTPDYNFIKKRMIDLTSQDIASNGLVVSGVSFETNDDKVRWICDSVANYSCICVGAILNWKG